VDVQILAAKNGVELLNQTATKQSDKAEALYRECPDSSCPDPLLNYRITVVGNSKDLEIRIPLTCGRPVLARSAVSHPHLRSSTSPPLRDENSEFLEASGTTKSDKSLKFDGLYLAFALHSVQLSSDAATAFGLHEDNSSLSVQDKTNCFTKKLTR
jgi:hypothetical protein